MSHFSAHSYNSMDATQKEGKTWEETEYSNNYKCIRHLQKYFICLNSNFSVHKHNAQPKRWKVFGEEKVCCIFRQIQRYSLDLPLPINEP
jgi:transposase-like protein